MAAREQTGLTALGTIVKAHGLQGGVIVDPDIDPELFREVTRVFIRDRRQDLIPYQIEEFRVDQKKGRQLFFVKLTFIDDRSAAEEISGSVIYGEVDLPDEQPGDEIPDITGWKVADAENRYIGTVKNLLESPAHLIITILKEKGDEILVPWVEEYVDEVDSDKQLLFVKNLDRFESEE